MPEPYFHTLTSCEGLAVPTWSWENNSFAAGPVSLNAQLARPSWRAGVSGVGACAPASPQIPTQQHLARTSSSQQAP